MIREQLPSKLLIPRGKPVSNSPKYFALVDILELGKSGEWLSSATRAIANYWKDKPKKSIRGWRPAPDTEISISKSKDVRRFNMELRNSGTQELRNSGTQELRKNTGDKTNWL